MKAMFRVTIRSEDDEVIEFESEQPVVHVDLPAGRFLITVQCTAGERADRSEHKVH
jgi:hypothetical protein